MDPHDLRGRVLVFKVCAVLKVSLFLVQLNDFHFVCSVLNERPKRQPKVLLWSVTEVHCIEIPG